MSCASCHGEEGKRIRMQDLPVLYKREFARPIMATWPAYRVSNSQFKTMQWRINDCYRQMRYPEPNFASDTTIALTTFLTVTGSRRALPRPGNEAMKLLLFLLVLSSSLWRAAAQDTSTDVQKVLQRDFKARGQATMDRVVQDGVQRLCTEANDRPPAELAKQMEADQLKTIAFPQGGLIGDWKNGERIAQNGRGLQWTDAAGAAGGGSCYNCHQLSPQEGSHGTLGPSLLRFGATRGNGARHAALRLRQDLQRQGVQPVLADAAPGLFGHAHPRADQGPRRPAARPGIAGEPVVAAPRISRTP